MEAAVFVVLVLVPAVVAVVFVVAAVVMLARLGVPRRRFREGGHSEAPSGRSS